MDVSASEMADALRAISDADLLDRGQLRRRLQVTLVKRAGDIPTFHGAFDLLFPALDLAGNDGSAPGPRCPTARPGRRRTASPWPLTCSRGWSRCYAATRRPVRAS